MAEGIDHTFMGDNAVGERELAAGFGKRSGHGHFPLNLMSADVLRSRIIGQCRCRTSDKGA
jgi:hypothetical protein